MSFFLAGNTIEFPSRFLARKAIAFPASFLAVFLLQAGFNLSAAQTGTLKTANLAWRLSMGRRPNYLKRKTVTTGMTLREILDWTFEQEQIKSERLDNLTEKLKNYLNSNFPRC